MGLDYVTFIDEEKVMPSLSFTTIKNLIKKRGGVTERTGWYFQQFLKMAYASICDNEWYLIWDIDTVLLRKINFFNERKQAVLDIKTEYHRPYFRTMKRLLNIDKMINGTFISEHMLINKNIMLDLIKQIECNEEIQGTLFFEKIIYATSIQSLNGSGLSEYETYGDFVMKNYPERYILRILKTLRERKILLGECINRKLIK